MLQVCPPGLHITLGIFQRLFNIFDNDCHHLDLQLILKEEDLPLASSAVQEYQRTRAAIFALEEEHTRIINENDQAQQILTLLLISLPDCSQFLSQPQIQAVSSLLNYNTRRLTDIVSYDYPEMNTVQFQCTYRNV